MSFATFINSKKKEIELPDFKGQLVADTHAHLDMLDDPARALARAALASLGLVVTVTSIHERAVETCASIDAWRAQARVMLDEAGFVDVNVPEVRIMVGGHPQDASKMTDEGRALIRKIAQDERVVGIGETGLDYFYETSPRVEQRAIFAEELRLADELDLVACLHIRDAHDEALEILRETGMPRAGAILHCYNLGPEVVQGFVELGCMVSFAGPLTFKKAQEVRDAAAVVPHDRLLTETDCPFMAPEPCRGQTNEPAYTAFTTQVLAESTGLALDECARITYANAQRFLRCDAS